MTTPPVYRDVLDGTEQVRVLKDGRVYFAPLSSIVALGSGSFAALAARVTALESRPEEAAHFTASAKLPALTVGSTVALALTSLVPALAGDRVRKGEAVLVEPAAALPSGVNIAAAYAPADDTVVVQLSTGLALAPGATAIVWTVTVLR